MEVATLADNPRENLYGSQESPFSKSDKYESNCQFWPMKYIHDLICLKKRLYVFLRLFGNIK